MWRFLGAAALLCTAGCLNLDANANSITLPFDYNTVGENHTPGVANVSTAALPSVNFVGEFSPLPLPLDTLRRALHLAGTNTGADLFLYQQKYFSGLDPNVTYDATLQVTFASNFQADCTTGAGPNTVLKAGISEIPLEAAPDNQGVLRLNLDVGGPALRGDYTVLGDIRNTQSGCTTPGTFGTKASTSQQQQVSFKTDAAGGFVLWVGIHTSAQARTEVYITSLQMVLF